MKMKAETQVPLCSLFVLMFTLILSRLPSPDVTDLTQGTHRTIPGVRPRSDCWVLIGQNQDFSLVNSDWKTPTLRHQIRQ